MSSRTFEEAAATSTSWKDTGVKIKDEEALKLYGLYKVGLGLNIEEAKKPGTFDFQGRYKYDAWKKNVNEGLTKEDAQKQYIEYVAELEQKYVK